MSSSDTDFSSNILSLIKPKEEGGIVENKVIFEQLEPISDKQFRREVLPRLPKPISQMLLKACIEDSFAEVTHEELIETRNHYLQNKDASNRNTTITANEQ
jgi:hypothetical protein